MRTRVLAAALGWTIAATAVAGTAGAQMAGTPAMNGQAASTVEPSKALDAMLASFEKEAVSAAEAMPADKYSFSPASLNIPGAKFEGVRTFGEEATHLAQANYSIYAGIAGKRPEVDVKAISNLKSKDEIVKALRDSFAFAHQAIAMVTAENANTAVRAGSPMTREVLAAYGVAHGFDHYGQMVEYLRMNGIVPPASAK